MNDESSPIDPRYIAARRVLLDALTALAPQTQAVIVAGAQAIYLRTGGGDVALAVAPFTTDGDLALDPGQLEDVPELEAVMTAAGFELLPKEGHVEPGTWIARTKVDGIEFTVPVDLIVPQGVAAGGGKRGARLGTHGKRAARRAVGLEAALVDHGAMTISALEPDDGRFIVTNVAGVAALFVAKLHKLHDRVAGEPEHRRDDKDAGDVIRLMQATSADEVGSTLAGLCMHEIAGPVSRSALVYIDELFGRRGRLGIQMAARALRLGMPEERVEALAVGYTAGLLASTSTSGTSPAAG